MDYPLLPADMGIPLLFTVKTNHFTSEKVGRTSGELKKKPFLGIQSYHLRSAKILGSTGWNWLGPHMMPWEAPNDLKTFHMDRIHHHESSEPTRGPQRTNSAPLKSLTGRKAPEKFQVPASKTFSVQRVVYCDNKDSFIMNIEYARTSYLSPQSPIYRWRKIGHVEKFQISIHNRCGEIRNFAKFGGISKFYTWQMWRHLKFTLFLVVKYVLWQFMLFFA